MKPIIHVTQQKDKDKDDLKKLVNETDEETMSNIEYTKCVVKALKEAVDENELVRRFLFS